MRRTKIICTIGPSTETKNKINLLISNGMNVARLNFSHGSYSWFSKTIKNIRSEAKRHHQPITIIQDLCGPKIRLGSEPANGLFIKHNDKVTIAYKPSAENLKKGSIFSCDIDLSKYLHKGQIILIDDGKIQLEVSTVNKKNHQVTFLSQSNAQLKPHKGINLPNVDLDIPSLTDKDIKDIVFGTNHNLEYIALSFVKNAQDIIKLKTILKKHHIKSKIIAKIETSQALQNIDEIIDASDCIMVARGDLGLETPIEQLPIVQKIIIQKCSQKHKPVIVATQMLASMTNNPIPSRAESSDVANAVFDNTDCVMLSEETAAGNFPIKTVNTMSLICRTTDETLYKPENGLLIPSDREDSLVSLAYSACQLATDLNAKFIIIPTATGKTAQIISSFRSSTPIVAACTDQTLANQLNLVWGIIPLTIPAKNLAQLIEHTLTKLKYNKTIKKGDNVIIVTSSNLNSHTANELLVKTI